MNTILKSSWCVSRAHLLNRSLSGTAVLETKQYRVARGLSVHKNAEGILTDAPDFTYLDGRPTPLLQKQKIRMLRQRDNALKIVELCSQLDYAKERHQNMQREKEEERQRIIDNRLKPKGQAWKKL